MAASFRTIAASSASASSTAPAVARAVTIALVVAVEIVIFALLIAFLAQPAPGVLGPMPAPGPAHAIVLGA